MAKNNLTEKWKAGELKEGLYYIKTVSGNIYIDTLEDWYRADMAFSGREFSKYVASEITEVITSVPTYKELKQLKQFVNLYSHETEVTKHLWKLLKECKEVLEDTKKDRGIYFNNLNLTDLLTRINAAIDESEE